MLFSSHLDDQVLDFLHKIKPLFTDVFLYIGLSQLTEDLRISFSNLLPMLGSIRGIFCDSNCVELLERDFPGTLAPLKELLLNDLAPALIPSYLNWLNTPLDSNLDGPKLMKIHK